MKNIIKQRYCVRKNLQQPFSFEICKSAANMSRHLHKNGMFVDVCSEGAKIVSNYIVTKGDILKIYFPLQEINESIPVFTEVMWCKPENDYFSAGLRFMTLKRDQF